MTTETANIAAILTPPGVAAIAVVRLQGPGVEAFVASHLSRDLTVGRATHVALREGDQLIDEPLAILVNHQCLEIHLHGGTWVVQKTLDAAKRAGFTLEHSSKRVIHSTEDFSEAVMLASLPLATTDLALGVLLAQPALWANVDPRCLSPDDRRAIVADWGLWWLLHPPRIAIVGEPNVGKSTIANHLFGHQRSITADLPGTTRDWVDGIADIDGLAVQLVDTPGVRESSDAIEQAAIRASQSVVEGADLVLEVLDAQRAFSKSIAPSAVPRLVVWNKSDLANPEYRQHRQSIGIETIASTGDGLADVKRLILAQFDCHDISPSRPRWWTRSQMTMIDSHSI